MRSAAVDEQELIEKIRALPPEKVAEVEDFVDFLRDRQEDQRLTRAACKLSEAAFERIWDNPDDADYDAHLHLGNRTSNA
ncbi:MAG: DUF2281 domain-containing protein [Deltaproteobacteria bacterium]|nr:DUF2281 domain-containing protein [Deltaproteobacteria bacterium]